MRLLSTRVIEMTDGWIALAQFAPHEDGRRGSLEGVDFEVMVLYCVETNTISQSTIDTFLYYSDVRTSVLNYTQLADFNKAYDLIRQTFINSTMRDDQSFYDWWDQP